VSLAVIGLGFGDEGKGKVVSSLCSQSPDHDKIVVRYCGGHQAGHRVLLNDGSSHVFSHFGSGTLQGVPTYWSQFCTVDPMGLLNELDILLNKIPIFSTDKIRLYIDAKCPITTPYEKIHNQQ
jgi:adenylosuccinate synthase